MCRHVLLALLVLAGAAAVQAQGVGQHDSDIGDGAVSTNTDGQLVVRFGAVGDLRGMLSLTLDVAADGTIAGGSWAIAVAYVEDLGSGGTPAEGEDGHEEAGESIRFVNEGTLGGSVFGGTVSTGAGGAPVLSNVQVDISSTSLDFELIGGGGGTVNADLNAAGVQGSLLLTF